MYYPAPKNPNLRLEWQTWQKVLNKHDSYITNQKRMKKLTEKLYGLPRALKCKTPSVALNGTTLIVKRTSKSCSPNINENPVLTKNKTLDLKNSKKEVPFPLIRKNLLKVAKKVEKLKNPPPLSNNPKAEETFKEEELFETYKKPKNPQNFPKITKSNKTQDLKLEGKKQVSVFKSFEIKRDTDTPGPWKMATYDNSTFAEVTRHHMSVAVSTETYFIP
jgi:hypothetical protein